MIYQKQLRQIFHGWLSNKYAHVFPCDQRHKDVEHIFRNVYGHWADKLIIIIFKKKKIQTFAPDPLINYAIKKCSTLITKCRRSVCMFLKTMRFSILQKWINGTFYTFVSGPLSDPGQGKRTNSWQRLWTAKQQTLHWNPCFPKPLKYLQKVNCLPNKIRAVATKCSLFKKSGQKFMPLYIMYILFSDCPKSFEFPWSFNKRIFIFSIHIFMC